MTGQKVRPAVRWAETAPEAVALAAEAALNAEKEAKREAE